MYYALPLTGHMFCGSVNDMVTLSALFQIYCRNAFGIPEDESLAMWVCGYEKHTSIEESSRFSKLLIVAASVFFALLLISSATFLIYVYLFI